LALIVVLYLVGLPVVAIAALVMARNNKARFASLAQQVEALRRTLDDLQTRAKDLRPETPIQPA